MKYTISLVTGLLYAFNMVISQPTPEPPPVHSVSIDPETGNTTIRWFPSPSIDFIEYYIVIEGNPVSHDISDKIDITENSWEFYSDIPHQRSVEYSVVAINNPGTEFRSVWYAQNTIFLRSVFDSCRALIALTWNEYNAWRGHIASYNIFRYVGPGVYELITSVPEGTTSIILPIVQPNQTFDLFVQAVHNDGRISNSNRIITQTEMARVPGYINADFATISSGNTIDLSFSMENIPGNLYYRLLHSNSFDGPFAAIDSFYHTGSQIQYTHEVPFTSGIQFYRLEVFNSCGLSAVESNRSNNIILNGSLTGMNAFLEWNEYRDWLGNVNQYRIIRTIGSQNQVVDTLGGGIITNFSDDISAFIDYENPSEGLVCYSIEAIENPNMYGIQGKSQSNTLCFPVNSAVRIPNAFIPNDSEPENQTFEPVFAFLPEHFDIIIYNRLGSKIWEGKQAWDGRVNGSYVPEGVYLYYIRVYNFNSEKTEFQGKVTVLYR